MNISKEQVLHVAKLARLSLSEEETQRLMGEMSGMIAFADKLKELDVAGIRPTTHAVPMQNVFRADGSAPSYDRTTMLKNSANHDEACIIVPRVVE